MSSGAVFLVVWNPDQDDKTPPLSASEYQDEWRPLQYWLDLIRQSCPNSPRIAIVCSHHEEKLQSLEKRLRARLRREDFDSIPRYYVDSTAADRNDDGRDLPKLRQWLESNVGEVVSTQGTQVPAYWEIAQDLVADLVRRMKDDPDFAARHNYLTPEQFRKHLNSAIAKRTANDAEGRFAKLTASLRTKRGKGFQLDDDRLHRTLEFLTHSGWAYWDPPKDGRAGRIPPGYEEPVNAIEQLLKDQPVITLVRDKISMERGDSIASFISHGAKCPHVIVVHSDKSWQSPYCCYELLKVRDELAERKDRDFRSVVIAVEHPTSRIREREAVDAYVDFWRRYNERKLPASIEGDPKHFVTASAPGVIEWFHRKLSDHKDVNQLWPAGAKSDRAVAKKREAVLAEIARCLRLENS